jgi:outer membrane lipoprotein-sorting protein
MLAAAVDTQCSDVPGVPETLATNGASDAPVGSQAPAAPEAPEALDESLLTFRLAQATALLWLWEFSMAYLLRRLSLSRLLLLCGLVVVIGISITALAFALGTGPTPPPKPLADAIHDALTAGAGGNQIQGVSANIQLTDHLLEGANLASGGDSSATVGQLTSSPLVTGASGRMWISKEGRVRLELQSAKGDTQVLYDGHTVSIYDAASNTLYRYAPPSEPSDPSRAPAGASGSPHEVPSVAKIEEAISHLDHVNVSGATPSDVAGQAAYTVRVTPKEGGSLIGGAELSWDAVHGVPLRAAIYSSTSASPTLELAATSISYGPVDGSVFEITPPSNAKVEEIVLPEQDEAKPTMHNGAEEPHLTVSGHGITTVGILEAKSKEDSKQSSATTTEGLQKVKIGGIEAAELPTALGTLLSFERSGVRYFLAGAVSPAAVEAVAKGL